MENIKPKRKINENQTRTNFQRGYLGPAIAIEDPKRRNKAAEKDEKIGLGRVQTTLLAISVISLAVIVGFLSIWINLLISDKNENQLVINSLIDEMQTLKNGSSQAFGNFSSSTPTYAAIPESVKPEIQEGVTNPVVAVQEEFQFEKFFKNSELTIKSNQKLTYYVCNGQAALRLIRDSQLPYCLSKMANDSFSLILFGDYQPSWIVQLQNLQEIINNAIFSSISANATDQVLPVSTQVPEELKGLTAKKIDQTYIIQILADSNLEKLKSQVNILRNEGISAFIYSYGLTGPTNNYSLRIGFFPTNSEADNYSKAMNRDKFLQLIGKDISDRFVRLQSLNN